MRLKMRRLRHVFSDESSLNSTFRDITTDLSGMDFSSFDPKVGSGSVARRSVKLDVLI